MPGTLPGILFSKLDPKILVRIIPIEDKINPLMTNLS